MARRIVAGLCVLALVAWAAAQLSRQATLQDGSRIEALKAELEDGTVVQIGGERGRVLVLNFWATWCGPCRAEAPVLSGLHDEGIDVVGIALDTAPIAELREKARAIGIRYPIGRDRGGLANRFGVSVVPTTYVLTATGVISFSRAGMVSRQELSEAVAAAR